MVGEVQEQEHDAVLLHEAVDALVWNPSLTYIDGTFGRGGHSQAVLAKLNEDGRLLAFDKDPEAVQVGHELEQRDARFEIMPGSFAELGALMLERGKQGELGGILLDLGVSSPQLDNAQRGFSFMRKGPLDMRMDPTTGQSAREWLQIASVDEIAEVLKLYGEERFAKRIASSLVEQRDIAPIEDTEQLAALIKAAHPRWERNQHPATRSFQGIRIFINRELDDLRDALDASLETLCVGGRLVVISFHSLEDRIVKRFIRHSSHNKPISIPKHIPIRESDECLMGGAKLKMVGKVIRSSEQELSNNRRARSAIMRVAERVI